MPNVMATVFVMGCVFLTAGCSGNSASGAACGDTPECASGSVCDQAKCVPVCPTGTCPAGLCCSAGGLCNAPCDTPPVIYSINGTGSTDVQDGHTSRHLQDALTILGESLSGATVTLAGLTPTTNIYPLVPCGDMTATEMNVRIPTALAGELQTHMQAGNPDATLVLSVTNAAGQCTTAQVLAIQGEAGADGTWTGTGADLVGELNTTTAANGALRLSHYVWKEGDTINGDLIVAASVRVGNVTDLNQQTPGYGRPLYFSGGTDWTSDSENTDALWVSRYNTNSNETELRVNVGDDTQAQDKLSIGSSPGGVWTPRFEFRMDGSASIAGNLSVGGAFSGRVTGGVNLDCNSGSTARAGCTPWGAGACTGSGCGGAVCTSGTIQTIGYGTCWTPAYGGASYCYHYLCVQ